ncbi:FAD-binding domain-containing protein [Aaosphaeria arxii CBS 175.79]|uniref:FAD-binding domain-containing protein n=1 Tax=Aaosphaeria arxii CBS 175.79 TaxID=1450172 RepID=A0A6A5XND2_9PLEO|nr:FAD-binding domain-containing protein [Aaosphaeria arxii CBS 175.79]KAF2014433.1 FAD-binding domain-containing protein [Aaosphaeria arxii CBS 175.79]
MTEILPIPSVPRSQTAWLTPSCVASPDKKEQVSQILKTVNLFNHRFSVRSGGHSPNPGFSILQGEGLLIDLRKINHIAVSSDSKIVDLGPGARWGTVYAKLDSYNVGVLGARIPTVGVGGAFLGGGFFHFSGQFGMAVDNLKSVEIVLADGKIVEASVQQNSDLFWAIKGGGPNYGIVVNYKANTVPVKNMWYQVGQYATSEVPAILDAFAKWQKTGASDVKATVALIIGLESTTLGFFYSEPATKPASFDAFNSLTPLAPVFTTNGTVQSLTDLLGGVAAPGALRHDYRAASSKVDAQLYKDVYAFWRQQADAVHNSTGANMTFTLQPVPPNLAREGSRKGGNPMGVPKEAHQWWTTLVDWTRAEDDDAVRAVPIATEQKWVELSKARGLHVPYLFLNDASRDQNPLASYGAANLQRMRTIAKKYDPGEVFQKLQNGGFLLSKA